MTAAEIQASASASVDGRPSPADLVEGAKGPQREGEMDRKDHAPRPQARGGRPGRAVLCLSLGCLALAALVVACSSSPLSRRSSGPKMVRQFAQTVRPPSSETARLLNNASILRSLGRSHLAVKELEEALQRDPGNLKIVDALAQCYEDLGDYPRAQALYEAALAKNPRHAALRNNLGFSYYQSGQWQKAESCLREAVKLDPANRQARNNLGLLLVRQGRQAEALALWQEREGEQVARELLAQAVVAVGEKAPVQTARRPESPPAPVAAPSAPAPAAASSSAPAVPPAPVAAAKPQVQPPVAAPRPPEVSPPPASPPVKEAQAAQPTPARTPQAAASAASPPPGGGTSAVTKAAAQPAPPAAGTAATKAPAAAATPVASGRPAQAAAPSAPAATSLLPKPAPQVAAKPESAKRTTAPAPRVTSARPAPPPASPQVTQAKAKAAQTTLPASPAKVTAAVQKTSPAPAAARPPATVASKGPQPKTLPAKAQPASPKAAVQAASPQREAPPSSQELLEHRLVLLNGNGRQGIARKHQEWLEMEGFTVAEVGNYRDFGQARTSISYLPGARRVAQLLAWTCYPQAELKEAASLPRSAAVLVILGRNQLAREAKVDQRLAKLRAMAVELAGSLPAVAPEPSGTKPPAATPSPVAAATPKAEGVSPPSVSLTSAELISTRISVKNGNGTKNIARAYRALLSRQGFTVTDIGNHIDFGMVQTTILYRPEASRVAQALAARFFPRARLEESQLADGLEVKVVLGKDLSGPSPDLLARLGP